MHPFTSLLISVHNICSCTQNITLKCTQFNCQTNNINQFCRKILKRILSFGTHNFLRTTPSQNLCEIFAQFGQEKKYSLLILSVATRRTGKIMRRFCQNNFSYSQYCEVLFNPDYFIKDLAVILKICKKYYFLLQRVK